MDRYAMFKDFFNNSRDSMDIDPNIWMSNYLVERMELNEDQIIWFCFLQAVTYHLPTAWLLFNEYPDSHLVDIDRLSRWWSKETQSRCPYQTDKLKQRKYLPETVESYQKVVNGSDMAYFKNLLKGSGEVNFDVLWEEFYKPIAHFGRFSTWNFAQNLKQIAKFDITPKVLFLGDSNAESITHGMCHVIDWGDKTYKRRWKTPEGKKRKDVHKFSQEEKNIMEVKAFQLTEDLLTDGFDLETMLCAYKKIWRDRDSRYVGYYLDRQAEDINKISDKGWAGVPWYLLYQARKEVPKVDTLGVKVDKRQFKLTEIEKISGGNSHGSQNVLL